MSHPRIVELKRHLDDNRVALRATLDAVPPHHRERRAAPDRWSGAEVIEHLAIVEMRVAARLRDPLTALAGQLGPEPETGPIIDRSFFARAASRNNRFRTSEAGEPRGGIDVETAWSRLEASRRAIEEVLARADGLDVSVISAPHPAFGSLTFYQWVVFLAAHEARHAAQIREVAADLAAAEREGRI